MYNKKHQRGWQKIQFFKYGESPTEIQKTYWISITPNRENFEFLNVEVAYDSITYSLASPAIPTTRKPMPKDTPTLKPAYPIIYWVFFTFQLFWVTYFLSVFQIKDLVFRRNFDFL